jgi:misacylated tRNA(Ala) deacylase
MMMMGLPKFMLDCYLREFDTRAKQANDRYIVLEDTIFYPDSGGQPHDEGTITGEDGEEYRVVYVGKFSGEISHEVDILGLKQGERVHLSLNWERRYTLMRMHTAAHVLSRVLYEEADANTSGNQLGVDRSRIDFTLEEFDREKIPDWIRKANNYIEEGARVVKFEMPKEEAFEIPGFAGPSPHLIKDLEALRVVSIEDMDAQPCGGTHLDDIGEIGRIIFVKAENKGRNNRRIYYTIE